MFLKTFSICFASLMFQNLPARGLKTEKIEDMALWSKRRAHMYMYMVVWTEQETISRCLSAKLYTSVYKAKKLDEHTVIGATKKKRNFFFHTTK
jgi:hypothetical protein